MQGRIRNTASHMGMSSQSANRQRANLWGAGGASPTSPPSPSSPPSSPVHYRRQQPKLGRRGWLPRCIDQRPATAASVMTGSSRTGHDCSRRGRNGRGGDHMESVIFTDAPAGSFIAVITRPTTTVPARRGDGTPTMVPRWCTTTVIPPSSAKSGRQRSAAGSHPRGKSPPPPPPSPPPLLPPPWPPSMRPDRADEVDEVDVLFRDVELGP